MMYLNSLRGAFVAQITWPILAFCLAASEPVPHENRTGTANLAGTDTAQERQDCELQVLNVALAQLQSSVSNSADNGSPMTGMLLKIQSLQAGTEVSFTNFSPKVRTIKGTVIDAFFIFHHEATPGTKLRSCLSGQSCIPAEWKVTLGTAEYTGSMWGKTAMLLRQATSGLGYQFEKEGDQATVGFLYPCSPEQVKELLFGRKVLGLSPQKASSAVPPSRITTTDPPATSLSPKSNDIVDLLACQNIEVSAQGAGITDVELKIRRWVQKDLEVRVPVGTFFICQNSSAQNMVATQERKTWLRGDEWTTLQVPAACANRPKDIPQSGDGFSVQRAPHQQQLQALIPILDKADVGSPVSQAAVWMVTDDADYDDLGTLIECDNPLGIGGTRVIKESEAAAAMRLCEQAGIDITRKSIWRQRDQLLRALKDSELKAWLEQHKP